MAAETYSLACIERGCGGRRDQLIKAVTSDPAMNALMVGKPMPLDCSQMVWAGFKGIV